MCTSWLKCAQVIENVQKLLEMRTSHRKCAQVRRNAHKSYVIIDFSFLYNLKLMNYFIQQWSVGVCHRLFRRS